MCQKAILCISDLHITKGTGDIENPSYVDNNNVLIDKLSKAVRGYSIQQLIILGDVANTGNKQEYLRAEKVLESLMHELNITDKERVYIIPGNHDINWKKYEVNISEEENSVPKKDVHTYHEYKLQDFKAFYDKFYDGKRVFTTDRAVSGVFKLNDYQVNLICINTLWQESYLSEDHYGYVDYETLRDDLKKNEETFRGCKTIAVFHHMPNYKDEDGFFCIRNWKQIAELFGKFNISIFIGGHAHTSESNKINDKSENYYLLTGSLSLSDRDVMNSFLLLEEGNDRGNQGFHVKYYGRIGDHAHKENWYWQELTNKEDTIRFLPIQSMGMGQDIEARLPFDENNDTVLEENKPKSDYLETAQEIVLRVLKEHKLFRSGHFHWSLDGRSHSYIKTNYYFENHECFEKIKISFINLIKENSIKTDLLIGYAMQGNVLGAALAAALNLKYT